MSFAVEHLAGAGHIVVAIRGDVDLATAPALRTSLIAAVEQAPLTVVDLDGVGFMDSTGLGVLVAAHHRATSGGRRLVVARPRALVRNALRLVQVDTLVRVFDTLDEALGKA